MTQKENSVTGGEVKELLKEDVEFLRPVIQELVQEILESEMDEALCARKGERTERRLGYRSAGCALFPLSHRPGCFFPGWPPLVRFAD